MVKIIFCGDDVEVEAPKGTKLMDLCQKNGCSIPFGCEGGTCGTCLITVTRGAELLSPATKTEKETLEMLDGKTNQRLACQCTIIKDDGEIEIESGY